jgi:hypothetical protein
MVLRVVAFRLPPVVAVTADLRKVGAAVTAGLRKVVGASAGLRKAAPLRAEASALLQGAAVTADLRKVGALALLQGAAVTADLPGTRLKGAGGASIRRCRSFCRSGLASVAGRSASPAW